MGGFCTKCCSCFVNCLSRIPLGTFFGLVIGIIGMLLFLAGFLNAMEHINKVLHFKGILDFGYKIAAVMFTAGIGLGLFVLLVACCTSGATRRNVLSGWKSKLVGKCFTCLLIVIQYVLYLAWAVITPVILVPVLLEIMIGAVCNIPIAQGLRRCIDLKNLGLGPILNAIGQGNRTTELCVKELDTFCTNMERSRKPLIIALAGAFLAALGTVHVLMSLSANFAYVKSFTKMEDADNESERKTETELERL